MFQTSKPSENICEHTVFTKLSQHHWKTILRALSAISPKPICFNSCMHIGPEGTAVTHCQKRNKTSQTHEIQKRGLIGLKVPCVNLYV